MDPLEIINRFYESGTPLHQTLVRHSTRVMKKSLEIATAHAHLNPDINFIKKAAMLHDIGIFMTTAKNIGCTGDSPYICHGYLGRQLLDDLGLPSEYGLVCERHTGAGISKENITKNNLPLPPRDMIPVTIEEIIICCADKYDSKSPKKAGKIISTNDIIKELGNISPDHGHRFSKWAKKFNL